MNTSPRLAVAVVVAVVAALAVPLQSEMPPSDVTLMALDEICDKVVENYESAMPNDHHDCMLNVKEATGDYDAVNFDITVPLAIFVNSTLERTRAAIARIDELVSEGRYGDKENGDLRACQRIYSDAAAQLERVIREMRTMSNRDRVDLLQSVVDGDDKCEKEHGGFAGYSGSIYHHAKGNLALAELVGI